MFFLGDVHKICKDGFSTFAKVSPEDFDKHVIFLLGAVVVNVGMESCLVSEGRVPEEAFHIG